MHIILRFFSEVAFALHTLAFISGSYSVTPTGLQNSLIGCVGHLKSEFGLVKVCPGSQQNKLFFPQYTYEDFAIIGYYVNQEKDPCILLIIGFVPSFEDSEKNRQQKNEFIFPSRGKWKDRQ